MDVLTDVLNTLHFRSTLYCRVDLTAQWGLDFAATRVATFHVIHCGTCQLQLEGEAGLTLQEGDLVVLPHGARHFIGSSLDQPVITSIALDQDVPTACQIRDYPGPGAGTRLLCGIFDIEQSVGHPLLQMLPALIHIRGNAGQLPTALAGTLHLLAEEAGSNSIGSETIVRRLTDILFIQVIRTWAKSATDSHNWLGALRDPQIGAALTLLHANPEQPWTVARLATAVAMSRSAFAQRFTHAVGQPPLTYLTHWRMRKASDLLFRSELSIAQIAEQIGYESALAFSKAFKRETGQAPYQHRQQARTMVQSTYGT